MKNFICIALVSFGILLPDLYLGYISKMLTCTIPLNTFLGVIAFSIALSFIQKNWVVFCVVIFLVIAQIIQINHWAYFGAPIHSHDITKVFFELDEITQTGSSLVSILWPVWVVLLISVALIVVGLIVTKKRKCFAYAWVPMALILSFTPLLSYLKGPSSFYTKPTSSTIYNTVRAFSDWLVNSKKQVMDFNYKPYGVLYGLPKVKNVILIIGESLSSRYMNLYGYPQLNTPFLNSLKSSKNFVYAKGVSNSVSTETCLQLFFNTYHNPGFSELIRKKDANLFRLARHQGFKTFVLSAQNEKLFHDTGTEFVNSFTSEKEIRKQLYDKGDEALLDVFEKLELADKNFIVIHLRHIHSPFSDYKKYCPELVNEVVGNVDRVSQTQQEYSNAIVYHDYWVKQCIALVEKILPQETIILFTSDHGELVGERGLFGHNLMQPEVVDVPFWAYTININSQFKQVNTKLISHYEMAKYTASLFGAEITNPNEDASFLFVHSSEIYTDYEFMPWKKSNSNPEFLKKQHLSDLKISTT